MDRNLALEFVRVTEAAAIAAAKWVGKGEKDKADEAAVEEMRSRFNQIEFRGRVVIGEGEKDEAPALYCGEKVGKGTGSLMDLAVDPLECTDSVAYGRYNALSVIVAAKRGSLLSAPDTYMEKIAVGPQAANSINLNAPVNVNIEGVARALNKSVEDLMVVVLDRERHKQLIKEIREAGARVRLITDGDVAGGIAPSLSESGIDILMGIGKSTEAVLAAAAIKILGGQILCRFKPKDKEEEKKLINASIKLNKIFTAEDLAKGKKLTFTATGVIEGPLLKGVRFNGGKIITDSLVMRGQSGTIRYITTFHKPR